MSAETDTDRTSVKTYVPQYQKREWKRHADELGMTQSEFVRTMVQAGRREFSIGSAENSDQEESTGSDPGGNAVEDRVRTTLADRGVLSWDELLEELSGNLEGRLEDALGDLQGSNEVRYSGRDGGYVLVDE